VIEKLATALHILVTGRGDARERVEDAVFACHTLRVRDFPEKLQKHWRWIEHETTKFGPYRDKSGQILTGSVRNTISKRKNSTASKIAKRFWDLYWAMSDNVPCD
jgi:hypothetical protein